MDSIEKIKSVSCDHELIRNVVIIVTHNRGYITGDILMDNDSILSYINSLSLGLDRMPYFLWN